MGRRFGAPARRDASEDEIARAELICPRQCDLHLGDGIAVGRGIDGGDAVARGAGAGNRSALAAERGKHLSRLRKLDQRISPVILSWY